MPDRPSAWWGFIALVRLSFQRQAQLGSMGWSTILLIVLMAAITAAVTLQRSGWSFESRWSGRYRIAYKDYPAATLDRVQMLPLPGFGGGITAMAFAPFRAMLVDPRFRSDFEFVNYSRWIIFSLYLGFLLPLVNLALGTHALGGEREKRTLIWLLTRPLPRPAIYLATWLALLPWSVMVSLASLAAIGFAGGAVGREAAWRFAPAAALGSVAFVSLFHLVGSIVRRPAVMGLAYIFFFETLVAILPGSLKQLSINYYVKSLFYKVTADRVATLTPEALEVYAPAQATTAAMTLVLASLLLTAVGAWWFGRAEPTAET